MGPKWEDKRLLHLENYMIAENISAENVQHYLIISVRNLLKIFRTLLDTGDDYKAVKDKLTHLFKPQVFTEYSKAVFRSMLQMTCRMIDTFYVRFKKQADLCGFDDADIKSNIVQTCNLYSNLCDVTVFWCLFADKRISKSHRLTYPTKSCQT